MIQLVLSLNILLGYDAQIIEELSAGNLFVVATTFNEKSLCDVQSQFHPNLIRETRQHNSHDINFSGEKM